MKPISPFGLPLGISITFWVLVGLLRYASERLQKLKRGKRRSRNRFKASQIAALLPAHNEGLIIGRTIQALKKSLDAKQIYVCSDGSADKTYRRARMKGVHVSNLVPGRGKAKALVYLLKRYRLFERYKLIFIVDADTRIDKECVKRALPLFNDPQTGVVFATSQIIWPQHIIPKLRYYFIAYRDRLNRILQYGLIYGQTWKYTNVNYVIPGFATIYRSDILSKLEIDTPGLLIEDFNLAFQMHKKKLAKIGFSHSLIGWDQYPDNLVDYCKQILRWNIGFFQTVRRNGVWPSFFWVTLGVFSAEVLLHSLFILLLPIIILTPNFSIPPIGSGIFGAYFSGILSPLLFGEISVADIFIGVFVVDYLVTVLIGLLSKKPQFLFYGLFFFFMHYVVSVILLASIIPGFFHSSSGRWVSPKRQAIR